MNIYISLHFHSHDRKQWSCLAIQCREVLQTTYPQYQTAHSARRRLSIHELRFVSRAAGVFWPSAGSSQRRKGTLTNFWKKKKKTGRLLGLAAVLERSQAFTHAHPLRSGSHAAKSHCGLKAGLVVNVFPVIAFPLLLFGHSLCVSGPYFFFVAHCRDMKRAVHKQYHVTRGFCRSGAADVALPHRTAPIRSWTLYNDAAIRRPRTRARNARRRRRLVVARPTCGS